jgi:hypothetical protein
MTQSKQAVVKYPREWKYQKQRYKSAARLLTFDFLCRKLSAGFSLQASHTDNPDHFADRKEQQHGQYQNGKIEIRCHRLKDGFGTVVPVNTTLNGRSQAPCL